MTFAKILQRETFAELAARMEAAGFVRMTIFVPPENRDELLAIAHKMRMAATEHKTSIEELSACRGKEQFADRSTAARVQARRAGKGHLGQVYRCEHCNMFHIGRPKQ
jgi:hypothetical protein